MTAAITMTVSNPALRKPEMQVDTSASLNVVLSNKTGADIKIQSGAPASTLKILFLPPTFITPAQLEAATIDAAGWDFSHDTTSKSLVLTATQDQIWAKDDTLTFCIDALTSSAKPGMFRVTLLLADFGNDVPSSAFAPLILNAKPQPGDADLSQVLQISLDNRGSVYRSRPGDPLKNTLSLNFKNVGPKPLYSGTKQQPQGEVSVSFVYGTTAGALAPAAEGEHQHPLGSAWNITGETSVAPLSWSVNNPQGAGGMPQPVWSLFPGNPVVLGTAAQANVSFSFSDIIAFTPIGHTQMYVQFKGFKKDDTTNYADHLFVLDISKQDPPPTRGLLAFSGINPVVQVTDPHKPFDIDVRWTMFDVASVMAITNIPGQLPYKKDYAVPEPIANDTTTFSVPSVARNTAYIISLQAFDGNGGFLNALQFATFAEAMFVTDKAGTVYPIKQFGDTFWMTEDYTLPVDGSTKGQKAGTMLYSWDAASSADTAPEGWRLPTKADWERLIAEVPEGEDAFTALQTGGSTGFNATLSGHHAASGSSGYGDLGAYWSATSKYAAMFLRQSSAVNPNIFQNEFWVSCRYVRNI
ncbi:FISUMP domain-containing protein [Gymnodinialimonas sp.]